jgi:DNA methylase
VDGEVQPDAEQPQLAAGEAGGHRAGVLGCRVDTEVLQPAPVRALAAPGFEAGELAPQPLDPFAGSGTTAEACAAEGVRCLAVERAEEYLPLIRERLNRRSDGPRGGTA